MILARYMHRGFHKLQMESVMKKLTATMKKMLDALAYADAGEYLSRREKGRVLARNTNTVPIAPHVPEPSRVRAASSARRVALYVGSELPPEVMEYVIDTCSRLQHELTVLTFESESMAQAMVKPYQQALDASGVDMELVTLSGEPLSGLNRYLRSHPEVAFLACKDSGYLGRSYLKGTQRKNALPVPVVVVTTAGEGVGAQRQPVSNDRGSSESVVA
jgi:hypothetical protein